MRALFRRRASRRRRSRRPPPVPSRSRSRFKQPGTCAEFAVGTLIAVPAIITFGVVWRRLRKATSNKSGDGRAPEISAPFNTTSARVNDDFVSRAREDSSDSVLEKLRAGTHLSVIAFDVLFALLAGTTLSAETSGLAALSLSFLLSGAAWLCAAGAYSVVKTRKLRPGRLHRLFAALELVWVVFAFASLVEDFSGGETFFCVLGVFLHAVCAGSLLFYGQNESDKDTFDEISMLDGRSTQFPLFSTTVEDLEDPILTPSFVGDFTRVDDVVSRVEALSGTKSAMKSAMERKKRELSEGDGRDGSTRRTISWSTDHRVHEESDDAASESQEPVKKKKATLTFGETHVIHHEPPTDDDWDAAAKRDEAGSDDDDSENEAPLGKKRVHPPVSPDAILPGQPLPSHTSIQRASVNQWQELGPADKRYVAYVFDIRSHHGVRWMCVKRYGECKAFNRKIKKLIQGAGGMVPPFPVTRGYVTKYIASLSGVSHGGNTGREFVDDRAVAIDEWLGGVLGVLNTEHEGDDEEERSRSELRAMMLVFFRPLEVLHDSTEEEVREAVDSALDDLVRAPSVA